MPITALPPAPLPTDTPTEFNDKSFNLVASLNTFVTETNTVQVDVNTKAATATTQAGIATTQANLATTNGAAQVALATTQAGIATTKANEATTQASLATTNGAAQVALAASQVALAQGQVTIATTKANEASISASNAEISRVQASKLNLGNKVSPPSLDNQGEPLLAGATYYDSTLNKWRVWTGVAWGDGVSAIAGVSSFNGLTGDVVYQVPQVTSPVNISPANSAVDVKLPVTLTVNNGLSLYGGEVFTKFQVSKVNDFSDTLVESTWLPSSNNQCTYVFSSTDGTAIVYYWRAVSKTTAQGVEYTSEYSTASNFTSKAFDTGNVDNLVQLSTIQQEYNPATSYAVNSIVIVRKTDIHFVEYKSLVSSNIGNNPETSPTKWELVYDNNASTSGYFGEVLGSTCVTDKGEWLAATAYSIGDMVVVKNIPVPKKQSDLTAYVALTANTNKSPASNPTDWEQRNALPTGTALANSLGLSATGAVLQNNDTGWLKFVHQGKVKYIAKKSFMHTVSWNDIAKAEAVYGNRTIRIGSNLFRVSVLSGAEADPSSWITTSTATDNKGAGSEWNQLVYRVCSVIPTDGATTYHGGKQIGSNWKDFSEADLNITGNGGYAWCKETPSYNLSSRVLRGYSSLSHFDSSTSSAATAFHGWRPCLTLISEPEADSKLYNAEASGVGPSVASLQYDPITDTGFYGETTTTDLYTGTQISAATAVTQGTLQFDTDPWLKFYWHGQVLYIAKKPYRHTVSWDNINTANAVYGVNLGSTGRTRLTKGSIQLDVKLLKGATKDPAPASSPGRQWDELIYRVAAEVPAGQVGANWGTYTNTDLQITGNGGYCWMQEVYQPVVSYCVTRGNSSLSGFSGATSSNAYADFGWRPCLALVR